MEYDCEGLYEYRRGKRRPNMPKSVTCHKCGKEAEKIEYGTYGCKECRLCYQFKYGKLVRGYYDIYIKRYTDKYGCTREKWDWYYGFTYQNGELVEPPLKR